MKKNDVIILIALGAIALALYMGYMNAIVNTGYNMLRDCGVLDSNGVTTCGFSGSMNPSETQITALSESDFESWYRIKNNNIQPTFNACDYNGQIGTVSMSYYVITCTLNTPITVTPNPPASTMVNGVLKFYTTSPNPTPTPSPTPIPTPTPTGTGTCESFGYYTLNRATMNCQTKQVSGLNCYECTPFGCLPTQTLVNGRCTDNTAEFPWMVVGIIAALAIGAVVIFKKDESQHSP